MQKIGMPEQMFEVRFDMKRLHARVVNNELIIEMPVRPMPGPLVTSEMRHEMVDRGLSPMEVDLLVDTWYDELQAKLVYKHMENCKIR